MKIFFKILLLICFFLNSCGIYRPVDARKIPGTAKERAQQNVREGKGVSINNLIGKGGTTFEFSSSNPLWRASLEVLDFIPLTTADYSGGIIITDWYSENNIKDNDESLKITIRFLNNNIQSSSIKVIVHKKKCVKINSCSITELNSKIKEQLSKSILSKAAIIEKNQKKK